VPKEARKMAENKSTKLADRQQITQSQVSPGVDLGMYTRLEWQIRCHALGGTTVGTIILQHASVDENLAYKDLGTSVVVTSASESGSFQSTTDFLRFVRFKASSDLNGTPTVSVDIVAKVA
jgi:hypothetical protein